MSHNKRTNRISLHDPKSQTSRNVIHKKARKKKTRDGRTRIKKQIGVFKQLVSRSHHRRLLFMSALVTAARGSLITVISRIFPSEERHPHISCYDNEHRYLVKEIMKTTLCNKVKSILVFSLANYISIETHQFTIFISNLPLKIKFPHFIIHRLSS